MNTTLTPDQTLLDCGHPESPHSEFTRGYGQDANGKKYCYQCCADRDLEQMRKDGKTCLYLTVDPKGENSKLTNWPGSLAFLPYRIRIGRHNMAGKRYDVWFSGPDSTSWHGVTFGDKTQICHCRKIKSK
jgi:hypothetical protein